MDIYFLLELAVNGVLIGLMYTLVALGIVLIFKSSGIANLAQGALAMAGAYIAWALLTLAGVPLWIAVPLSLIAMFFIGAGIERVALRPMIGQPVIMVIMLTLGLEILLRGLVPAIFGSVVKRLDLGIPQAPVIIGPMLINTAYLVSGGVALGLVLLSMLFFGTRIGTVLRAVSDDQTASWSVGISVERAIGLSWGMAGVAAASGGILWGSVQGVDWTLSLLLLKALAVAILGGLDSIFGVLIAGMILGVLESVIPAYLDPYVGGGSRDVVASMVILLTVIFRPHGLFGREDIERV
ncbi:MAG TPA: branched-chain amino acid ABC transporter permease [Ferrovibrio sp.]|jgi:branched-chain amino acid transport system permease protein|uniref:branched-chain amino acid ABC transporter permease n=1 Tax=Ferrovibrio sp. TaxID=1917215 RepID=UPI0026066CAA|nr:branched-chain amino acid ABC transporter permease [Ferrovibrio sp.]HLT77077.1 branched-chain amino acid ABC transporter permease [Ferrovibrio sp.]